MGAWEAKGATDEWYTPKYIFDALDLEFDLDVAAPIQGPRYAPAKRWYWEKSLDRQWHGLVWMNPPFGARNALVPWLDKFFSHGNGIALTPDRTSAPWWQDAAKKADCHLLTRGKVKFERPDGSIGKQPGHGVTLFASGRAAQVALLDAQDAGLGLVFEGTWI